MDYRELKGIVERLDDEDGPLPVPASVDKIEASERESQDGIGRGEDMAGSSSEPEPKRKRLSAEDLMHKFGYKGVYRDLEFESLGILSFTIIPSLFQKQPHM